MRLSSLLLGRWLVEWLSGLVVDDAVTLFVFVRYLPSSFLPCDEFVSMPLALLKYITSLRCVWQQVRHAEC